MPGLAGGLPAHRAARAVQLLRGVHPPRRLDVQPARQVARRLPRHRVATPDRVADLPAHQPRLAPGPQRVLPPGPRLHRPRAQQEAADRARLPAAGREHPAVDDGPLPAHPELRQRRGGRQAAGPAVADDGRGGRALHARPGDLGLGEQLRRRRTRRGARLRGRRPDPGGRRGGEPPAPAPAGAEDPAGQRRRHHAAAGRAGAPARALAPRVRRDLHHGPAGDLRLPRLPVADPPPDLPARQPREHPRARLQGGGHHHHAVRHGDAQRPRPLPPGDRRDRPGAGAGVEARRAAPVHGGRAAAVPAATRASTAKTRRTWPTGSGPAEPHEGTPGCARTPGFPRSRIDRGFPGYDSRWAFLRWLSPAERRRKGPTVPCSRGRPRHLRPLDRPRRLPSSCGRPSRPARRRRPGRVPRSLAGRRRALRRRAARDRPRLRPRRGDRRRRRPADLALRRHAPGRTARAGGAVRLAAQHPAPGVPRRRRTGRSARSRSSSSISASPSRPHTSRSAAPRRRHPRTRRSGGRRSRRCGRRCANACRRGSSS